MPGSLSPAAPCPMARELFAGSNQDAGRALGLEGGLLCQLIHSPEYNLFPNSVVFESNFIQVTKKGKWMDLTHTPIIVTLAVTSSDPCLPLPNVLLMANQQVPLQRVHSGSPQLSQMDLTRLLPLRYVRLSVHSASQHILRLQMVTKMVYYLQLHHEHPEIVFALWSCLINILQNGLSTTTKDPSIPIRHCLISSCSSSASSISPLVEESMAAEGCPEGQPDAKKTPKLREHQGTPEFNPMHSDTVMRSAGVIEKVGSKMSGTTTQFFPSPEQNVEKPRRVSFQVDRQSLEDTLSLSSDLKLLFYDLPPPLVCVRCKGQLPRTEPQKYRLDARPADSDVELAPWMNRKIHGLWQQETPTWLQPLCRLSSLAAAGWK